MSRWLRAVLVVPACLALAGCGAGAAATGAGGTAIASATASPVTASAGPPSASAPPVPATASPPADPIAIEAMTDMSAFAAGQVGDAIAAGPGFMVVGYVARAENGVDAAVWSSADGRTWAKGPAQQSFANTLMTDVTARPGGFSAGGAACPPTGGGECVGINLWTSSDGVAWAEARLSPSGEAECCLLVALTAGGPGVVGMASDVSDVSSGPKDAVSLTSADGSTWVAHRRAPAFVDADATSVVAGGPGLVAVGGRADGSFAAWSSKDGKAWTSARPPTGKPAGEARDVIAAGPGFVAVGKDGSDAAVWTSADGLTWTRLPAADALKGGVMDRVTRAGDLLVAVGKAGFGAAVWTSPDGIAWTRSADQKSFEGTEMTSVAASGKTVVIFGKRPTGAVPAWIGQVR